MIHTVKDFDIVDKAEIDVFFFWNSLAFSMIHWMLAIWSLVLLLFVSPACTSRSSQFTYYWSLVWRIFEHYLASLWNEHNCRVVWTFFGHCPFWGIRMKTGLSQSCGHCWIFQICWHIECSTFTALSFRIVNSSAPIPSLPLFVIMFPKAHLTLHSRMSGL